MKSHKRGGIPTAACEDLFPMGAGSEQRRGWMLGAGSWVLGPGCWEPSLGSGGIPKPGNHAEHFGFMSLALRGTRSLCGSCHAKSLPLLARAPLRKTCPCREDAEVCRSCRKALVTQRLSAICQDGFKKIIVNNLKLPLDVLNYAALIK